MDFINLGIWGYNQRFVYNLNPPNNLHTGGKYNIEKNKLGDIKEIILTMQTDGYVPYNRKKCTVHRLIDQVSPCHICDTGPEPVGSGKSFKIGSVKEGEVIEMFKKIIKNDKKISKENVELIYITFRGCFVDAGVIIDSQLLSDEVIDDFMQNIEHKLQNSQHSQNSQNIDNKISELVVESGFGITAGKINEILNYKDIMTHDTVATVSRVIKETSNYRTSTKATDSEEIFKAVTKGCAADSDKYIIAFYQILVNEGMLGKCPRALWILHKFIYIFKNKDLKEVFIDKNEIRDAYLSRFKGDGKQKYWHIRYFLEKLLSISQENLSIIQNDDIESKKLAASIFTFTRNPLADDAVNIFIDAIKKSPSYRTWLAKMYVLTYDLSLHTLIKMPEPEFNFDFINSIIEDIPAIIDIEHYSYVIGSLIQCGKFSEYNKHKITGVSPSYKKYSGPEEFTITKIIENNIKWFEERIKINPKINIAEVSNDKLIAIDRIIRNMKPEFSHYTLDLPCPKVLRMDSEKFDDWQYMFNINNIVYFVIKELEGCEPKLLKDPNRALPYNMALNCLNPYLIACTFVQSD